MLDQYRIYDHTDKETLADSIDTYAFAEETLHLLKLLYPHNHLEIEKYTKYTVKPGFGRDPDLH